MEQHYLFNESIVISPLGSFQYMNVEINKINPSEGTCEITFHGNEQNLGKREWHKQKLFSK